MVTDPRYIIKEEPNEIPKMSMAESLTCGTFVGFLVILPPPTLALVLCHLACCVGFVFFHVALLLCCLGLLSRCICCCAPPLCYVASLFCFFFSFLVCISWLLFCFCSLSEYSCCIKILCKNYIEETCRAFVPQYTGLWLILVVVVCF